MASAMTPPRSRCRSGARRRQCEEQIIDAMIELRWRHSRVFKARVTIIAHELVEVESLAIADDEAATMLPPNPSARHKRILARLYTLISKTANQAGGALAAQATKQRKNRSQW